jgi:hypothetical protein
MSAGSFSATSPAGTAAVSDAMKRQHGDAIFGVQHRRFKQRELAQEDREARRNAGASRIDARLKL